jgi:hypothetical protein
MGRKKHKYALQAPNAFDEGSAGAGGVEVLPKGKAAKKERGNKVHTPANKILILCEGETEVNYFRGISESETVKSATIYTMVVKKPEANSEWCLLKLALSVWHYWPSEKERISQKKLIAKVLDHHKTEENEAKNKKLLSLQNLEAYRADALKTIGEIGEYLPDQIWLVFDNDDSEDTKKDAFKWLFSLAKDLGLRIAYSKRQWEQWILLHFELNRTAFEESECKNKLKTAKKVKQYDDDCRCSLNVSDPKNRCNGPDCQGNICVGGYLRKKRYRFFTYYVATQKRALFRKKRYLRKQAYHPFYKKGHWEASTGNRKAISREYCYEGLFAAGVKDLIQPTMGEEKVVFDKIRKGIRHAEELRRITGQSDPTAAANPYTDVDKLAAILIGPR